MKLAISQFYTVWRLANVYTHCSVQTEHGKLTNERPPNISVESLKLNGQNKEVGGGLTLLLAMLDSLPLSSYSQV